MTELFLITFLVLGLCIAAMAVGVIFSNRKLKGSCGGLGVVMGEDCMFCDKKEQCDEEKKKMKKLPTAPSPFDIDPDGAFKL